MNLQMRKAAVGDVAGLDQVMQVISDGPGEPEKMRELIAHITKDDQKYLLVAEDMDSGRIVGSLYGLAFEDICGDGSPILLVENVAVLAECQGMGVGRMMFEEIERWGREQGCHYEMLVSGMNRKGAHQFYGALGFDEVKGFKKYLK